MQVERHMCLSHFHANDWTEIVALRCDSTVAIWASSVLREVANRIRASYTLEGFKGKMLQHFQSVIENEDALNELRAVKQIGRVFGYTHRFQEFQSKIPTRGDHCSPWARGQSAKKMWACTSIGQIRQWLVRHGVERIRIERGIPHGAG